ncbi:MAG: hypothetical protein ABIK09_07120 [Pseudomonadota bacterium]
MTTRRTGVFVFVCLVIGAPGYLTAVFDPGGITDSLDRTFDIAMALTAE